MTVQDQPSEDDGNLEEVGRQADDAELHKEVLEEALREKEQFRTMAQRSQADLENYKRRSAEEIAEVRRNATSQLLLKTLLVVDDLERAMSHIPDDAVAPGWLEGLQLVMRSVETLFESEGVNKIEAADQPFDPREAEAVHYQETTEAEEGHVISVVREGYKHRDKILRAAQVIVAKAPERQSESEPIEEESQNA